MNFVVRLALSACLLVSGIRQTVSAEALGVAYPDLHGPYGRVFETIIDGIEQASGTAIDKYALEKSFDSAKLESSIKGNGNRVVIALDARSRKAMRGLDLDIPVVLGEIFQAPIELDHKEIGGISPFPDTTILFRKLISLAPGIRKVIVVYNPDKDRSLIDDALKSANTLGLTLEPRPARDFLSSAPIFREIAQTMKDDEAVWLHSNIENSIFEDLLRKAWDRRFVVFTNNNMKYAERGALFSMVPDDFQMGRELGKLAVEAQVNPVRTGVARLKSLKTAVNKRAADHLGISLDRDSYDWLF